MSKGNFESVNGRLTHYGPRGLGGKEGRSQSRVGNDVEVVYEFTHDELPLVASEVNEMINTFPEGSHILEASFTVVEAFAGSDGSSTDPFLAIGLAEPDGTAIDADGLVVVDALTDVDAVNDVIVGAGALIDTAVAEKSQLVAALDGSSSLTAGKGKVFLKYRAPGAVAAGVKTY